jgi:hypothetical protein
MILIRWRNDLAHCYSDEIIPTCITMTHCLMNKIAFLALSSLIGAQAIAEETSAMMSVTAQIPYDPPQMIIDNPGYAFKLNGSTETIEMCIYDGSVDASQSQSTRPGLQIRLSDNNTSGTDGARVTRYVYSIGKDGDPAATGNRRIDFAIDATTPGWGGNWPFLNRDELRSIGREYSDHAIDHAATTSIKFPFKCVPFNLNLYPLGKSNVPGSAERPAGKMPGNYSGILSITLIRSL